MAQAKPDSLWIRCGVQGHRAVQNSLVDRLIADDDPLKTTVTGAGDLPNPDQERELDAFLDKHKPTAMLWLGGVLNAAILEKSRKAGLAIGVAGLSQNDVEQSVKRPIFARRHKLHYISFVLAHSIAERSEWSKAGLEPGQVHIGNTLLADPIILPCSDEDRSGFAMAIGPRSTCLADAVSAEDVGDLTRAFKQAARSSHRLLLIVTPRGDYARLADALRDTGLMFLEEANGDQPDSTTQIYLARNNEELGLYLRIASFCVLFGSFRNDMTTDPMLAAALGCAIIAGLQGAPFETQFTALAEAGALAIAPSLGDLGASMIALLSPDRTANLAHAGWEVSTKGADALSQLEKLTKSYLLNVAD